MSNVTRTQEESSPSSEEPTASPAPRRETSRQENSRSTLFEKIPPDLRRALDVAIAEHVPPTFRAVWMQFELAKFGVSFAAFYRYARRVRERVNLIEAAALAGEDDADVDAVLKKLTGRRALDLLLHSNSSECLKEIAALVSAHAQTAWLDIADRRIALGRRRLDEESEVARARLELDRENLRLKSELLHSARDGALKLLNKAVDRPTSPENLVNRVNPVHSSPPIPHSDFRIPTSPNPANHVHSREAEPLRLAKLDEADSDVATVKSVKEKSGTDA